MPKAKVLVTHPLYPEAQALLQSVCDCEFWSKAERPPKDELLRRLKDKEGLVCLLTEKVNDELLRAAPKLRIAANVAVGYDNIDVDACTKRGVVATNTPGVLDETTADFAWTLMMAVARRLAEGEVEARLAVGHAGAEAGQVRAFFDAAVATGAEVLHEPRVWPEYHPNYYGAFVRDPDGNNIEAVCHHPED